MLHAEGGIEIRYLVRLLCEVSLMMVVLPKIATGEDPIERIRRLFPAQKHLFLHGPIGTRICCGWKLRT